MEEDEEMGNKDDEELDEEEYCENEDYFHRGVLLFACVMICDV